MTMTGPDIREIEDFLFAEADLLDAGLYADWSALFTEDGDYWVPASPGQPDPLHHVSLIYEDRLLRAVRVERFADANAFSVHPAPRSSHLVANIRKGAFDPGTGLLRVTANFVVTQQRLDEKAIFSGRYLYDLVLAKEGLRIRRKRVDLVDCDRMRGDILIYI
jgi:3-phenylpropionate/cinnamic acid dioxygenase small subunit